MAFIEKEKHGLYAAPSTQKYRVACKLISIHYLSITFQHLCSSTILIAYIRLATRHPPESCHVQIPKHRA